MFHNSLHIADPNRLFEIKIKTSTILQGDKFNFWTNFIIHFTLLDSSTFIKFDLKKSPPFKDLDKFHQTHSYY